MLTPSLRLRGEMAAVEMEPERVAAAQARIPVYFMYRGLARSHDASLFEENKVRFDVTVIPPGRLGPEFVKTAGHYHPEAEPGLTYPELYEVLLGTAQFLLQKPEDTAMADVILAQADAGDKLLIPPNYGHVTINPGTEPLVMANLVSSSFESLYEPYKARHGAAYYELAEGRFVPNPRYGLLPPLRSILARQQEHRLPAANIYGAFVHDPASMAFINRPSMLSGRNLAFA